MKLKFKQQKYQNDAVMSVIDCFTGQKKSTRRDLLARYTRVIDKGTTIERTEEVEVISFGNHPITLTELERRNNIRNVQNAKGITLTESAGLQDFSIEMETGTGKTYTYIKTMYELHKFFGWSKFIVMVPSIAIREGVQKSFQMTEDHFQELYNKKIRCFTYNSSDSSNIVNINNFVSDDNIQVMIINYQAFSAKGKANRRIFEELDELQSRKPIDVIKSVRPILIIDEPQKFGDKTEKLFDEFNPLFTLRYSATHKKNKEYNKIYKLDAVDAYNQKLVKRINVKGIEVLHNKSEKTYLFLNNVNISSKQAPEAIMEIETKTTTGVKRKIVKIRVGDDLFYKSGELAAYKGYVVSEIDGRNGNYDKVYFTNGFEIEVGQAYGDIDQIYLIRIQIRETIQSHFEKEKELFKSGIKVLSLFFIDEVSKYKYYENSIPLKGEYAKIFEEEYMIALNHFRNLLNEDYVDYLDSFQVGKVHAGYFSVDKKGKEINSNINDKKEYLSFDEGAYDLIMRDKERLLSLEEPVRFIFSHSALREGWDNPNIFQICTLKHSNSEISKRQEIGRGLRICVNTDGERMDTSILENDFHAFNTLTVIASESYDKFANALQAEFSESLSERPKNFVSEVFVGRVLVNDFGEEFEFTEIEYQNFLLFNVFAGYVDKDNDFKITDKLIEDIESKELEVMPHLVGFEKEITALLEKLYFSDNTKLIHDERRENIKTLEPNRNFMKKEFQDLWAKINSKSIYEVSFDSEELIDKSVIAINSKLSIDKMKIKITEGAQKDSISAVSLKKRESMSEGKIVIENINDFTPSQIEYDLIGELTRATELTRKTIVKIMSRIEPKKFNIYKYNPEEFIRKVSTIINQEKAVTVIEGIKYHKTNQFYSNDIFTINNPRGEVGINAFSTNKHIYDFLITDSKNELKFAEKLEVGEVCVYAKLPNGFKIPTPVGNYNPDWAIVFDNSSFKYVYFIAETKGSMNSLELREIEKIKIECARKHFAMLCDDKVKYDVVDNYETLMDLVT